MKKLTAVIAMIAAAVIVPATLFAWGPTRPTYTIENPADHVTFNSITNNPAQGDERNFVKVRDASAGDNTYADSISLTAGHEYVMYIYYHNNAASNLNASGVGIAHGAYVKAEIPGVVANGNTDTKALGDIGAANATPGEVWDDVSFSNTTGNNLYLSYVPGSATIHNFGATNGQTLSDNIATTGASLGYDSLNGDLPGCNEYAGYVILRVKETQPSFTIEKQVRIAGTTDWQKNVTANAGDSIEYRIRYENTGAIKQNNVVIKDVLPAHVSYVTGSTTLTNKSNPNGKSVTDDLTSVGINIGNYSTNSVAFLQFSAKVGSIDALTCGANTLTNTAEAQTGDGSKQDTAVVTVNKTCDQPPKECKPGIPEGDVRCKPVTPPELPHTGPMEDILSILGLGAMVASIGYYLASRRKSTNQ